nr:MULTISPECIES: ATP-binding protein [unclassified Ruminococcus]
MSSYSELDSYKGGDYRITVIDSSGKVLYENTKGLEEEKMDNHSDRPECIDAERNGVGISSRYSNETGDLMYYYAVKLENGDILRVSKNMYSVLSMFNSILPAVVIIGSAIILICWFLAKRMSRHITKPIVNMAKNTERIAYDELAPLSTTIEQQREQIWRKNEELLAENEKIKTITANMSEGLIFLDTDGRVIMHNESAQQIMHTKRNVPLHPVGLAATEREKFEDCISRAKKGKNAICEIEHGEKNLQIITNSVFVNNVQTGVVCLIVDITHHKSVERMKQEFTANVSHELKTPLTSISGYAEMIESGIAKDEDVKSFASKIHKEAKRLVTLIGDIIKLSRLEEEASEQDRLSTIDMEALLSECRDSLEMNAKKNEVSIEVSSKPCKIKGDREMVYELVYNLCDNAIRYNKHGGKVMLSVEPVGGKVVLAVEDTGIGIPSEHIDRVFERFYRVDKSRSKQTGGTGLGLAIVKHIAEQHEAKIDIESEHQKGTKITVSFKAL